MRMLQAYIAATTWRCGERPCSKSKTQPDLTYSLSRRSFASLTAVTISTLLLPPAQCQEIENTENFNLQRYFKKVFADDMEFGMAQYERNMAERKRKLFSIVPHNAIVADIGIGTGPNLPYLPKGTHVIGIEPNEYMWPFAKRRANGLGLDFQIISGRSENIPLPDNSCDAAITTLTLCSVKDIRKSLSEVTRILRPGGIYIFIEHVTAPKSRPLLRTVQNVFTPLQKALCDGCHLNRDIENAIRAQFQSDLNEINVERFDAHFGLLQDFVNPIRPHVAGYVRLSSK